jgi:ribosomal protein S18 acetylase RimI-like enzyme
LEIRRARPEEWRELRDTRLRALQDAPEAFATRYEDARGRPDEWWIEWAARSAAGDEQAMFVAWEGDAPVGIVGTYRDDEHRRWLISMWADPRVRRRGLGRRLVACVTDFAPGDDVHLQVRHTNGAARALYERCGFVEVDRDDLEAIMLRRANR